MHGVLSLWLLCAGVLADTTRHTSLRLVHVVSPVIHALPEAPVNLSRLESFWEQTKLIIIAVRIYDCA